MGLSLKLGKGDKTEFLLGAALALIIVFALGMTVWHFIHGPGGTPPAPKEMHFKCLMCKAEKTYKTQEVPEELQRVSTHEVPYGKCPDCGKMAMVPMDKCPKCGAYYVSQFSAVGNDPSRMNLQKPDICPSCGVNIMEYAKQHAKK